MIPWKKTTRSTLAKRKKTNLTRTIRKRRNKVYCWFEKMIILTFDLGLTPSTFIDIMETKPKMTDYFDNILKDGKKQLWLFKVPETVITLYQRHRLRLICDRWTSPN